MVQNLWFFGGGGHAKVVLSALARDSYPKGFYVSDPAATPKGQQEIPYVTATSHPFAPDALYHTAIGNNQARHQVHQQYLTLQWHSIIHPTAIVDKSATIAPGCFVGPGAIINAGATIGPQTIINTGSIIEHDVAIGTAAHICPGTVIAGGVCIGDGVLVAANSTVIPGITIGEWSIIGAGSVVIHNIKSGVTAVGSPCSIIK